MVKADRKHQLDDASAGGKRSAMAPGEDPGDGVPLTAGSLAPSSLTQGVAAIAAAVKTLPGTPGVYRMLDRKGEALYVGKARNLKKRVIRLLSSSSASTSVWVVMTSSATVAATIRCRRRGSRSV